jgi:hypothetical protein
MRFPNRFGEGGERINVHQAEHTPWLRPPRKDQACRISWQHACTNVGCANANGYGCVSCLSLRSLLLLLLLLPLLFVVVVDPAASGPLGP